jgi:hypothetical protein
VNEPDHSQFTIHNSQFIIHNSLFIIFMLKIISIKSLYVLALAEGEGVGTAYEYFAKRLVLRRWLADQKRPSRILIAGLPEKYGSSLDFLQLVQELGAEVTVVDERPLALEKLHHSLAAAQKVGWLTAVAPQTIAVDTMTDLSTAVGPFDLVISSEVMQRLSPDERVGYIEQVVGMGTAVALFAPNSHNAAHTNISGLSGITLSELNTYKPTNQPANWQTGYIDMPPFPPGITRSDDQREQATSGRMEALAMWGLGYYARAERFLPQSIRRSQSHIVYALLSGAQP